jgi:hypothetical protein
LSLLRRRWEVLSSRPTPFGGAVAGGRFGGGFGAGRFEHVHSVPFGHCDDYGPFVARG